MRARRWPSWAPRPTIGAGSWQAAGGRFTTWAHPDPVPIERYRRKITAQIGGNGIAQTVIGAAGSGQASAGPSGIGARWFPQQVSIATKTGPADTSTCIIYRGTIAPSAIVATSYAGGGDTIGLAVPEMQPGDLLIAVWSGATPGDWASLAVVGEMEALTT